MKKEGFGCLFNSQDGKVNIVLLVSIVLIFTLSMLYAEAVIIKPLIPSNLSFNTTANRNITFYFNVTWDIAGENASNCSLYVIDTFGSSSLTSWDIVRNVTNGTSGDLGFNVTNFTISFINFTFRQDGNYTWSVACFNATTADTSPVRNFSTTTNNLTFFLDASPPSFNITNVSIFNTSSLAVRVINFSLNDTGYGINMTKNHTIHINITLGNTNVGNFSYVNDTATTNLSCTATATATTRGARIFCNASFNFGSNGIYIINITAVDALGNSNSTASFPKGDKMDNDTVLKVIVDQIPPTFWYYNITMNASIDPAGDAAPAFPELNNSDESSAAQGRTLYAVANWTDNLTQALGASLQFYNGTWQTLNVTSAMGSGNGSWSNFSFPIPTGHNTFEGKNISFRIIANDTVDNINNSMSVKNFTIQINDTTAPTLNVSSVDGLMHLNGTNTSDTTPLIGWNISEPSNLRNITVQVDGSTDTTCGRFVKHDTAAIANLRKNFSLQVKGPGDEVGCTVLGNGTHTVRLTAEDTWGNAELYIHTFVVETQAPGLVLVNFTTTDTSIEVSNLSAINNTNITSRLGIRLGGGRGGPVEAKNLTYISSCNTSATRVFTNNTVIFPFNESSCPTQSANRTLTVTITDHAGNSNTTVLGFTVDNAAPTIAVHSPTDGGRTIDITDINVSALDSESQVQAIVYFLDGRPVALNHTTNFTTGLRLTDNTGTNTSIMVNRTNFTPGTHTLKISVNDTLGNVRNSSVIRFVQTGPLDFPSLGFNATSNYNTTLMVYSGNLSFVNLTNASNEHIGDNTSTVTDQTLNLFLALNETNKGVNVTITFNASAANWDMYNFSARQNTTNTDSTPILTHIVNNWTTIINDFVWFNESIQEFIPSNNSYYGIVNYPINASNASGGLGIGASFEVWFFNDVDDLTVGRTNVTECSQDFAVTKERALSAGTFPCWNSTNNASINVYVPHFSAIAFVNNSEKPTVNVTTPSVNNQTVAMFIPNISVSLDTVSCAYSINNSRPNVTMALSGARCTGQTERFTNLSADDGGYNLTFTITDEYGNINRYVWDFNITDGTPPHSPGSGNISTGVASTSATITISNLNETSNATILYGTSASNLDSRAHETDFNNTQEVSLSGLTASTQYHFNVSVCDFAGNCVMNGTFNFTTSAAAAAAAAATTSAGGGGGGAAAPSNEVASSARRWDSLTEGSSAVLEVNNEKIAVTGVAISVKNAVTNAEITVASLASNPYSAAASAKVYQYLQLKKGNIADEDASKITISFRVPKSWLTANNVAEDDVVMYRYSNAKWNALTTTKTGADVNNVLYEAITLGFSTFAIGTKEAAPAEAPPAEEVSEEAPPSEEVPAEVPPEEEAPAEAPKGLSSIAVAWIVVLIIVVLAAVGYYMWQKKKGQ